MPLWVDEVLGGPERYTIKEDGGTVFKDNMQILLKTAVSQAATPMSAALMNLLENLPEGTMVNGRILPSVASNNLTLALKTFAGTDPSASDPVLVVIGGALRVITAALSVVKNAATNWCNLGGAELATKETDLFAYLVWNTNLTPDAVDVFFSRYPGGRLYSSFSATATDEKYAAVGATAPAATDVCVLIGRFAATLSAGAGYTWSVPTYTAINLVQRPIYETRWLDFYPTPTNLTHGSAVITAKYKTMVDHFLYHFDWKFGAGSAVGTGPAINLPWKNALVSASGTLPCGVAELFDSGTASYAAQPLVAPGSNSLSPITLGAAGSYVNQAFTTATVPFTWATNDEIIMNGDVPY